MSKPILGALLPIILSTVAMSQFGAGAAGPAGAGSGSAVASGEGQGQAAGRGKRTGQQDVSSGVKSAATQAKIPADVYVLDFPANARVAELTVSEPVKDGGKDKERIVLARGRVLLPTHCRVGIDLRYDGPEHMSSLEQINAALVTEFSAGKLELNDAQLEHIRKFKNLTIINLAETSVSDKALPLLGSLTNLKRITINASDITGSGFEALASLHKLTRLSMEGIKLQHGSLAKLKPLSDNLAGLNVSRTELTNMDIKDIGDLLSLTHLDLSGNNLVGDASIKYLHSLTKLKVLDVTDTGVTEKSIAQIGALPNLEMLIIRGQRFWNSPKDVKRIGKVKIKDSSTNSRVPLEVFSPLH